MKHEGVETLWNRLDGTMPIEAHALTFTGIPLEYWRGEVALHCAGSLARLREIVAERGCDYEMTLQLLEGTT